MRDQRSLREKFYTFLIKALLICAAVLLVVLLILNLVDRARKSTAPVVTVTATEEATTQPITLLSPSRSATAQASALNGTPSPEPTAMPTPEPAESYDYLPIYNTGHTGLMQIAITVDDCSQPVTLQRMLQATDYFGGQLTLFPSYEALSVPQVVTLMHEAVAEKGYEVGNKGKSAAFLYKLSDTHMAEQIWEMDTAIDNALNMDYQCRFFRPYGAMGTKDARTHEYLKQLGYEGVVTWSVNGSALSAENLQSTLEPGKIYLFSSTEDDTNKMFSFMQYASAAGYSFVTLSELLGYPPNESSVYDASYLFATVPPPENPDIGYETLQNGDCSHSVYRVQTRLAELGYLDAAAADGVYGQGTATAISLFQVKCGMLGTAVCDAQTQEKLFAEDAPVYTP